MMKLLMVDSNNEAGFSLIEIVLVLAISSALVVIVFNGQRQLRDRTQFSQSIEAIVGTFNYAKNAAFTTVNNTHDPSVISDPDVLILGTVMKVKACPSKIISLYSLKATTSAAGTALALIDQQDIAISSKACYVAPSETYIAYVRERETGNLQTYQFTSATDATAASNYTPGNRPTAPIFLNFADPDRNADIIIDGQANSISRRFN